MTNRKSFFSIQQAMEQLCFLQMSIRLNFQKIVSRIKSCRYMKHIKIEYFHQRFLIKFVENIKHNVYTWTIGKYLIGTYTRQNGKTFNEKSISIDVVGVEKNTLFKIAEDLKTVFKQEAILVKWNNQVYFVS